MLEAIEAEWNSSTGDVTDEQIEWLIAEVKKARVRAEKQSEVAAYWADKEEYARRWAEATEKQCQTWEHAYQHDMAVERARVDRYMDERDQLVKALESIREHIWRLPVFDSDDLSVKEAYFGFVGETEKAINYALLHQAVEEADDGPTASR